MAEVAGGGRVPPAVAVVDGDDPEDGVAGVDRLPAEAAEEDRTAEAGPFPMKVPSTWLICHN